MSQVFKLSHSAYTRINKLNTKNLYAKGNKSLLSHKHLLGVVGSREVSEYGKHVIPFILRSLNSSDIVIVSGLSRGVDFLSHTTSLQLKFKNIAVLPCGINYVYPVSHAKLVEDILANEGLLLSEYDNFQLPRDWSFIERNKIIAKICDSLLVIEAGDNSGSLTTARFALKFGKKVFVIPGDIFRKNTAGIAQLMTEGATACVSARQINDYFGLSNIDYTETEKVSSTRSYILNHLGRNPATLDELIMSTGKSIVELSALLIELELAGKIYNESGVYHAC